MYPGNVTGYIILLILFIIVKLEALRYKLEGRRFDSWWCHWNFSL